MEVNVQPTLAHAALVRPRIGERVSGDTAVIRPLPDGLFVAIVDVLGHGPEAHEVATRIDRFLTEHASVDVAALLQRLHVSLRGSRGAAVGLCAVDAATGRAVYVGSGNTTLRRFGTAETRLVSQDGVVGQNLRTPLRQELVLGAADLLVLYTDGVRDHFVTDNYPGIFSDAPDRIVRVMIERFGKDYDDAGCIAVRYAR